MLALTTIFTLLGSLAAPARAGTPGTYETSSVAGHAFDRIAIIYFENINYDKAAQEREST